MKSRTMFVVLMSGAGALSALAPIAPAAEDASSSPAKTPAADASEERSSLQISSEVAPDFLAPAPSASVSSRAQWKPDPLLQSQPRHGVWLDGSGVQLLDAPPQLQGAEQDFEIEILPAQPPRAAANAKAANAKSVAAGLSLQTQQAAKIAVERAQLLESAGVPVMAGAQLRRAVSLAPRDIASRRALAQWTAQHEQWPEAAAQWREVLYQLKMQRAAPTEVAERELWRAEATREMRTAQDHLLAFWQVPNVVTLGANSENPVARNTPAAKPATAITVAMTSSALTANAAPRSVKAKAIAPESAAVTAASPVIAPLIMPTPELQTEAAKSALENVVAALPSRPARRELRFEIVVTSSSYLRPQNVQNNVQNVALQADDKVKVVKTNEAEKVVSAGTLDSSREAARQLSMQRQMQPWLGDIVRIGSDSAAK